MRLIVEKNNGQIYVYRETEFQFKKQKRSEDNRVTLEHFAHDCDTNYMPDNSYLEVKIK